MILNLQPGWAMFHVWCRDRLDGRYSLRFCHLSRSSWNSLILNDRFEVRHYNKSDRHRLDSCGGSGFSIQFEKRDLRILKSWMRPLQCLPPSSLLLNMNLTRHVWRWHRYRIAHRVCPLLWVTMLFIKL